MCQAVCQQCARHCVRQWVSHTYAVTAVPLARRHGGHSGVLGPRLPPLWHRHAPLVCGGHECFRRFPEKLAVKLVVLGSRGGGQRHQHARVHTCSHTKRQRTLLQAHRRPTRLAAARVPPPPVPHTSRGGGVCGVGVQEGGDWLAGRCRTALHTTELMNVWSTANRSSQPEAPAHRGGVGWGGVGWGGVGWMSVRPDARLCRSTPRCNESAPRQAGTGGHEARRA